MQLLLAIFIIYYIIYTYSILLSIWKRNIPIVMEKQTTIELNPIYLLISTFNQVMCVLLDYGNTVSEFSLLNS